MYVNEFLIHLSPIVFEICSVPPAPKTFVSSTRYPWHPLGIKVRNYTEPVFIKSENINTKTQTLIITNDGFKLTIIMRTLFY